MVYMVVHGIHGIHGILPSPGHSLTVTEANTMIRGGSSALKYVHDKGYVHCDISSDNFLVFRNTQGVLDIKLGDFGEFYKVDPANPRGGAEERFTPRYAAPERFLDPTKYEQMKVCPYKNDVWAWGLMMWEISSWVCCSTMPR